MAGASACCMQTNKRRVTFGYPCLDTSLLHNLLTGGGDFCFFLHGVFSQDYPLTYRFNVLGQRRYLWYFLHLFFSCVYYPCFWAGKSRLIQSIYFCYRVAFVLISMCKVYISGSNLLYFFLFCLFKKKKIKAFLITLMQLLQAVSRKGTCIV